MLTIPPQQGADGVGRQESELWTYVDEELEELDVSNDQYEACHRVQLLLGASLCTSWLALQLQVTQCSSPILHCTHSQQFMITVLCCLQKRMQ